MRRGRCIQLISCVNTLCVTPRLSVSLGSGLAGDFRMAAPNVITSAQFSERSALLRRSHLCTAAQLRRPHLQMSKPVEAVRAALEEDVMQLRLHVGGSFAGELPHVYVSFAFGSTKDCSMEPVRDDGVCNSAHVQALRVRIADPSRIWAAGPSIGAHMNSD